MLPGWSTWACNPTQRVAQYPKDQFPTLKVCGDVAGAELRLITCGGEFDQAADSYRDNIVVYAGAGPLRTAAS
jgi:hypothetical protein